MCVKNETISFEYVVKVQGVPKKRGISKTAMLSSLRPSAQGLYRRQGLVCSLKADVGDIIIKNVPDF